MSEYRFRGKAETGISGKTVKLLFDIKRNRNIAHKAGLAEAILQKYLKQTKPEELSWQEWEKIKIQPEDVLRKLKGILSLRIRHTGMKSGL